VASARIPLAMYGRRGKLTARGSWLPGSKLAIEFGS
jgi:hypothetical protein